MYSYISLVVGEKNVKRVVLPLSESGCEKGNRKIIITSPCPAVHKSPIQKDNKTRMFKF